MLASPELNFGTHEFTTFLHVLLQNQVVLNWVLAVDNARTSSLGKRTGRASDGSAGLNETGTPSLATPTTLASPPTEVAPGIPLLQSVYSMLSTSTGPSIPELTAL